MRAVELIADKRDGGALSAADWEWFVRGFVIGDVPDYQMAAMLMAIRLQGMDDEEAVSLTLAMAASGDQLDLRGRGAADKHSTGGVGDKVTLAVAPIVAACGVPVAKMTGRGLAHSGGTLDKLESISGIRTRLDPDEFLRILDTHGLVIAGQSESLAPADAGMYALRDVTATVDSIPLIAASIMSKKLAVGAETILLDVKVGSGAFMKTMRDARRLARLMVRIGREAGRRTAAVLSEMDEPLGRAVGNALEMREAIEILQGAGPEDAREFCLDEAAEMLLLAGRAPGRRAARSATARVVADGSALALLSRVVQAQGGDHRQVEDVSRLPRARVIRTVKAPRDGYIARIDALAVGRLTMALGAGRATKHHAVRHDTGVLLLRVHGDGVEHGEPVAEIHADAPTAAEAGESALLEAIAWSDTPPPPRRLMLGHVR